MKRKYKLIIFDVDGTLLDTSAGLISSVNYTVERFNLDPLSDEMLRSFIGPPIQKSFSRAYGLDGDIVQEIATVFRDRYKHEDLLKAEPYEGIYEVFTVFERRGIKTAIATYKREDYALMLLEHFGFNRYTSIIHGADHENKLSKSDIIEMCINEAGVDREEVLMVGDTENDAQGAKNLNVDFLAVTYGFGYTSGKMESAYPYVGVVNSPIDILSVVDNINLSRDQEKKQ